MSRRVSTTLRRTLGAIGQSSARRLSSGARASSFAVNVEAKARSSASSWPDGASMMAPGRPAETRNISGPPGWAAWAGIPGRRMAASAKRRTNEQRVSFMRVLWECRLLTRYTHSLPYPRRVSRVTRNRLQKLSGSDERSRRQRGGRDEVPRVHDEARLFVKRQVPELVVRRRADI